MSDRQADISMVVRAVMIRIFIPVRTDALTGERQMGHEQKSNKEAKKKPAKTAKEKRAEKHAKHESRAILGNTSTK